MPNVSQNGIPERRAMLRWQKIQKRNRVVTQGLDEGNDYTG
jgi:hypothetical protein